MRKKLYKIQDIEDFDIEDVRSLYKKFVNPAQVNVVKSFGFGQELVSHAIGQWIYLKIN